MYLTPLIGILLFGKPRSPDVWAGDRRGSYESIATREAAEDKRGRPVACDLLFSEGGALGPSMIYGEEDSFKNDKALDNIVRLQRIPGISNEEGLLLRRAAGVLVHLRQAWAYPSPTDPHRAAAELAGELARFRDFDAPVWSRERMIAAAISWRLLSDSNPRGAAAGLVRASELFTPISPTIGQKCLIGAIELYRKIGEAETATRLFAAGKSKFGVRSNPTQDVFFWEGDLLKRPDSLRAHCPRFASAGSRKLDCEWVSASPSTLIWDRQSYLAGVS